MRTTLAVLLALAILVPTAASAVAGGPVPVQFGPNVELSVDLPGSLSQREPTIAANPKNPKNMVAGFFGRRSTTDNRQCWFVSTTNAGSGWRLGGMVPLLSSLNGCADPALAADSSGKFYFAYLEEIGTPEGFVTTTDVRVAKSTDGGRSFPQSTTVVTGGTVSGTPLPDKDYIAVDAQPNSPFNGTIYVSYTDFPTTDIFIEVNVSRDGGQTWSSPVSLDTVNGLNPESLFGSLPVVAPDGTVYIFYMKFKLATQSGSVRFSKSTDGGMSWTPPADVATNLPTPGFFLLNDGSPDFGTNSGSGIVTRSYPTAAIAPDGTIYVAWTDFPNGSCSHASPVRGEEPTCADADVRLSVSRDDGATWTPPVKVSDDVTASDQFFPWIAVGPDGLLSLIWQDRRLDPNNVNYDVFYTNTSDGVNFLPNVRITSQTSRVDSNYNGGDYSNLVVTGAGIFPVWNDYRSGINRIYTARGSLSR